MRCARVDSLLDRLVDGALKRAWRAGSPRMSLLADAARSALRRQEALPMSWHPSPRPGLPGALPKGSCGRSTNGRWLGDPCPADVSAEREAQRSGFYRRLGLSFMLSAGLLAVSLLVPRASYPTIIGSRAASAELSASGPSIVKDVLAGAGRAVQGALGETADARSGTEGGIPR